MSPTTETAIKVKDIAFTAYGVQDMEKARQFYEGILGLTPANSFGEGWQEYAIGNGTFAIIAISEHTPPYYQGRGAALALEAEDLDIAFEVIQDKNVKVLQQPMDFPNCRMFVVSDPDDNVVTFHQLKR